MKKSYKIDVDCANCAAKMERAVAKIQGVNEVSISFLTQKIMIDADDEKFDAILQEAAGACKKIDRAALIHIR